MGATAAGYPRWLPSWMVLCTVLVLALAGCRSRRDATGELHPPRDAREWTSNFAVAFDDSFTPTEVNLTGRAPNDVQDQRLFAARLGHADIVALVRIDQVWGKGRYEGRQDQFVELSMGELLMGQLDKDVNDQQMLMVRSRDELPGTLKGELMILFLRWDPDGERPFHHHLMPAQTETVSLIKAMVAHAEDEGVMSDKATVSTAAEKRKRRRERKKTKRAKRRPSKGE